MKDEQPSEGARELVRDVAEHPVSEDQEPPLASCRRHYLPLTHEQYRELTGENCLAKGLDT